MRLLRYARNDGIEATVSVVSATPAVLRGVLGVQGALEAQGVLGVQGAPVAPGARVVPAAPAAQEEEWVVQEEPAAQQEEWVVQEEPAVRSEAAERQAP